MMIYVGSKPFPVSNPSIFPTSLLFFKENLAITH